MNISKIVVMAPLFILILIVIFHVIRSAFDFGEIGSFFVSACISMLSVIGMDRFLKGSMEIILLPYAAMGIAILLLSLLSFTGRYYKRGKDCQSNHTYTLREDHDAQTDDKQLKR